MRLKNLVWLFGLLLFCGCGDDDVDVWEGPSFVNPKYKWSYASLESVKLAKLVAGIEGDRVESHTLILRPGSKNWEGEVEIQAKSDKLGTKSVFTATQEGSLKLKSNLDLFRGATNLEVSYKSSQNFMTVQFVAEGRSWRYRYDKQ